MSNTMLRFEGFSICVPEGWEDITETLDYENPLLTVANPASGVGALQFSLATYKSGPLPSVQSQDLSELLEDYAIGQGLENPFDCVYYSGDVTIKGASFHSQGDLFRAWYASDGKSIMLVTYISEWVSRDCETSEREAIVRSIRFES